MSISDLLKILTIVVFVILILTFKSEAKIPKKKIYGITIKDKHSHSTSGLLLSVSDSGLHYMYRRRNTFIAFSNIKQITITQTHGAIVIITGLAAVGNLTYGLTSSNNVLHGAGIIAIGAIAIPLTSYAVDELLFNYTLLKIKYERDKPDVITLRNKLQPYIFVKSEL